jgi:outer membrane lipoprotein-sorting protein
MKPLPVILPLIVSLLSVPVSAADSLDVKALISRIDSLYRSESSYAELEMEIVNPHWERTMTMKAWTEGLDKTFIRILSPAKERGVGTLRIENEMWNYLPKTNKVIKIPPSMMMSSWMGSDFTNDDLVKEFSLFEDYTYELIEPDDPVDSLVYVNCIPHPERPIVWGNIVIAARRADTIPVWQKYYDEDGKLMRLMEYSEVTVFDGRKVPAVMTMIPQDEEGHRTTMRYNELEFDVDVAEDIFSLRNLRTPDL